VGAVCFVNKCGRKIPKNTRERIRSVLVGESSDDYIATQRLKNARCSTGRDILSVNSPWALGTAADPSLRSCPAFAARVAPMTDPNASPSSANVEPQQPSASQDRLSGDKVSQPAGKDLPAVVRVIRSIINVIGLTLALFFGCSTAFAITCTAATAGMAAVTMSDAALGFGIVLGLMVALFVCLLVLESVPKRTRRD
jgi:hypothetical protein